MKRVYSPRKLVRDREMDTRPEARPPTFPLPTVRLAPTADDADMTTPESQSAVTSSGSTVDAKRVDGDARRAATAAPRVPRSCCASVASSSGPTHGPRRVRDASGAVSRADGTALAPLASGTHVTPDGVAERARIRPFAATARWRVVPRAWSMNCTSTRGD